MCGSSTDFLDIYDLIFLLQKPIRKGVVGHTLMVEELGRRKVAHGVKL